MKVYSVFNLLGHALMLMKVAFIVNVNGQGGGDGDQGVFIGSFTTRAHLVAGDVYMLSPQVLEIRQFTYDGLGPAAFFWASASPAPNSNGLVLADPGPNGNCALSIEDPELQAASNIVQRIEFPVGTSIADYWGGSISIWCEAFNANFGELVIPMENELPMPLPGPGPALECSGVGGGADMDVVDPIAAAEPIFLGDLITVAHQVSGQVWLLSEKVFEIRNFVYDGTGPAAYFWLTQNPTPDSSGIIAADASPSNNCALTTFDTSLPEARGVNQRVEIPGDLTINDFLGGSLSVWCEAFAANFGHFTVPTTLTGSIPGPVALECSDESPSFEAPEWIATPDGYNCEELNPTIGATGDAPFHVRWRVDGDWLDVELIGRLPEGEYFGFGVSGATDRTEMVGADAQVAYMRNGQPTVRDYFLSQRAQCSGTSGVCRDAAAQFTDDVRQVSSDSEDGITVFRYRKPLQPTDVGLLTLSGVDVDQTVITDPGVEQFIIWAVGPIDPDTDNALFHSTAFETEDRAFQFGRAVSDNCSSLLTDGTSAPTAATPEPWKIPRVAQDVTEITAHIGPSGGDRGYEGITGNSPWGIAWYLNGNLIPQMVMERGRQYNFIVNGGVDPFDDSNYHPFYITDSSRGGYLQLTPEERLEETPLAGIQITNADANGVYDFQSTGVGPICRYEVTDDSAGQALEPYPEWLSTLDTSCAWNEAITGQAAVVSFTPDENTPDKIFYHCVTHFNLGWEILVVDEGATLSPTVAPTEVPSDLTITALEGQLEGAFLSYRVDLADSRAGGQDTVSFIYKVPTEAWAGVAFSNNGGSMVGSEAVIGLPDEGTVLKYSLNSQSTAGVTPLPDVQQTLIDTSINQDDGQTVLRFTKIMVEDAEIPIILGTNTFLAAYGFGNSLSTHASRESFSINLESGGVQQLEIGEQSLWKAHGWFASIAWGLLCPLAIGAGILRKMLKAPLWFTIHRALNMLVIVFTVIAFSLAVAAINRETPTGTDSEHFNPDPFPHRLTGLIIFILALLQAIIGIFRPHATEDGEEKTLARKSFEFGHRFLGYTLVALAWYQVDSGIKIFQSIYIESRSTNLVAIFWGVVGGIVGLVALGFVKIRFFDSATEGSPKDKHLGDSGRPDVEEAT